MFIDDSKVTSSVYKHLLIGIPRDENQPGETLENVRVFLRPYEDVKMAVEELVNSCSGKVWVNINMLKWNLSAVVYVNVVLLLLMLSLSLSLSLSLPLSLSLSSSSHCCILWLLFLCCCYCCCCSCCCSCIVVCCCSCIAVSCC